MSPPSRISEAVGAAAAAWPICWAGCSADRGGLGEACPGLTREGSPALSCFHAETSIRWTDHEPKDRLCDSSALCPARRRCLRPGGRRSLGDPPGGEEEPGGG